jgi:hypothetical protein
LPSYSRSPPFTGANNVALGAYAVTSLSPPAHSCSITSDCNRREGKPKLSASWVGLRMIVTFHQLGTADEGRTRIARGLPKGGSGIRAAGPSRPPDIVAQDSNIIRIVLAQAGARCGRTCGRDSKCPHSLNSQCEWRAPTPDSSLNSARLASSQASFFRCGRATASTVASL